MQNCGRSRDLWENTEFWERALWEIRENCWRDESIMGEEICADNGVLVETVKNCGRYRELLENQSCVCVCGEFGGRTDKM